MVGSVLLALLLALAMPAVAAGTHDAIRSADLAALETALGAGADIESLDRGETPLTTAALAGNTMAVRLLLGAGARPDGRNRHGLTALHAAAYAGHADIVELLVNAGVQVNDRDNRFGITALHAAAEENRGEAVRVLLARGADPSLTEINGYTPLTRAGWREHWEIHALLLSHGAACQPAELVGEWLHGECTSRQP